MNEPHFYFDFSYTGMDGIQREQQDVALTRQQADEYVTFLEERGAHSVEAVQSEHPV